MSDTAALPQSKMLVKVPLEVRTAFRIQALRERRTMSDLTVDAMVAYLRDKGIKVEVGP